MDAVYQALYFFQTVSTIYSQGVHLRVPKATELSQTESGAIPRSNDFFPKQSLATQMVLSCLKMRAKSPSNLRRDSTMFFEFFSSQYSIFVSRPSISSPLKHHISPLNRSFSSPSVKFSAAPLIDSTLWRSSSSQSLKEKVESLPLLSIFLLSRKDQTKRPCQIEWLRRCSACEDLKRQQSKRLNSNICLSKGTFICMHIPHINLSYLSAQSAQTLQTGPHSRLVFLVHSRRLTTQNLRILALYQLSQLFPLDLELLQKLDSLLRDSILMLLRLQEGGVISKEDREKFLELMEQGIEQLKINIDSPLQKYLCFLLLHPLNQTCQSLLALAQILVLHQVFHPLHYLVYSL